MFWKIQDSRQTKYTENTNLSTTQKQQNKKKQQKTALIQLPFMTLSQETGGLIIQDS